tara:strand:- start:3912 stop:4388 length:477 start_codon:yes stop_codon:yes gene_type:complete
MSRERNIVNQIVSNLEAINGSGYTFDISGTDQVIIGDQFNPIRVPCAYVFVSSVDTNQEPGVTVLTQYDRTMTLNIIGFLNATNDDPGELMLRSLDFQSDVMKCLESDRSLGNGGSVLCDDLEVSGRTFRGADLDLPMLGIAALIVTIRYRQDAGTGT